MYIVQMKIEKKWQPEDVGDQQNNPVWFMFVS